MANANVTKRYINVYPIINGLGTDIVPNGDMPNAPVNGVCISKAALRQRDSLGIIRLAMIPTLTAVAFCIIAPNCSIHPPMNARPYKPKTTPPVANEEKELEHAIEMDMTNKSSK